MAFNGLDAQAAKLADPSTDINVKLVTIRDLSKTLAENQRDSEYPRATATIIPILIDTLKTGSPAWKRHINEKDNVEHILRLQILDLLRKFGGTEAIRPHLAVVAPLLLDVARTDTEDMAVVAIKIFQELVRVARPLMEAQLQLFLVFTVDLFNESEKYVEELFGPTGAAMVEPDRSQFPKAFPSLKLFSETLVLCTFLYQTSTAAFITQSPIQTLVDSIAKFYTLQAKQETEKDKDQMDEGGVQFGVPPGIVNEQVFVELVSAQVKAGPLLGYIIKKDTTLPTCESWANWCRDIPPASIRMLRAMSPDAYNIRREAIGAIRNLAVTELKHHYPIYMHHLVDERLLFGNLRTEPGLCQYIYSSLVEAYGQVRPLMSIQQILPHLKRYAELISDPSLPSSVLTHASRALMATLEHLNQRLRQGDVPSPETALQANTMMHALIETLCTRVQCAVVNGQRLMALRDGSATDELKQLTALEQSRTLPVLGYLSNDSHESWYLEERFVVRVAAMSFKLILMGIRTLNGRVPDADVMGRAFKNLCLAAHLMKGDPGESVFYKHIGETFCEMEPHVFQTVWTLNMELFFQQLATQPNLSSILTYLFTQPPTTYSLTALVLKYLVDNLEVLLETPSSSQGVAILIRTIRLTFISVASLQESLDRVLFPILPKVLVDVFPMAARSHDPRNFLSVPYYLFRAFGQKAQGARFEALHKEVFPLLPEVLDGVNRRLELTDDPVQREQLVEIALTTPTRLQHLAPHMAHLWRPLVLALGSRTADLLRQGLRTLELAVENLTNIDLLDPEAGPVARELVLALHKCLKPGQQNAETAQAASRILGKIGGRNRRILGLSPTLSYETTVEPAVVPIEFSSHVATLKIKPACEVAAKVLEDPKASVYHEPAFQLLRAQTLYLLQKGIDSRATEDLFTLVLDGLVSGIHLSNVEPGASELLREIAKALFELELSKPGGTPISRMSMAPATGQFLETIITVLMNRPNGNHSAARRLIANVIQELYDRGQGEDKDRKNRTSGLINFVVSKFGSLCYQSDWRKKVAGAAGVSVLISDEIRLGYDWPYTKEFELSRALVTALKDMPYDPPAEVTDIRQTLMALIRFCNPPKYETAMQVDGEEKADRSQQSPEERHHYDWVHQSAATKAAKYLEIVTPDLWSPNEIVRETTRQAIALYVEISGIKESDVVRPVVDKISGNCFSKPLRMFSHHVQIGYMDSMRYLLDLDPQVLEPSEELWRLLNEVIGIAEADDIHPNLLQPHQKMPRRYALMGAKTKAMAIRLVTSAFPVSDFFQKHPVFRQRSTTLLFQGLYSSNSEIKSAAHDGLKILLGNHNRLPREHLQAGLRPVLMNLADPNKLTVASLEGLARLLGLLMNYFKVEIATKLIDHFKALSDPETLRDAAYGPLADHDSIAKLVHLLHIFHLLPVTANVYLEQVCSLVVEAERSIHAASPTPFTQPLALFLNRFAPDGLKIIFDHIKEPRWVQTFRHVIQGKSAPNLVTALQEHGERLAQVISGAEHANAALPSILLCLDLSEQDAKWMSSQEVILDALKDVWEAQFTEVVDDAAYNYSRLVVIRAIYTIWIQVFKITPRVDILFRLSLAFTRPLETNYSEVIEFFALYVANETSVAFRRQAISNLFTALEEASVSEAHLLQYLRYVVIPLLTAQFRQTDSVDEIFSDGLIAKMVEKIWTQHATAEWSPSFCGELLHMTGILVGNAYNRIGTDTSKGRGAVAKYIWEQLKSQEPPIVRNTASLAAARFLSNKEATNDRFQTVLWSGLLKVPQDGEAGSTTRQALDIMLPVVIRNPSTDPNNKWDAIISRTLTEEQHNMVTTLHIYRLLARHADSCYPSRDLFIPLLVPGLNRLASQTPSQAESRTLAGDMVDLIINWLKRAAEEEKSVMVVDSAAPEPRKWAMPDHLKDSILQYFMRHSIQTPETYQRPGLTARHLTQLKTLFGLEDWVDVNIKLNAFAFARTFEIPDNADASSLGPLISNVKVLSAIASQKPAEWFTANATELFNYSKRTMISSQDIIVDSFSPIFERLVDTLSLGSEGTELSGLPNDVYQWISEIVREPLSNGLSPLASLSILTALVKAAPSRVEPFVSGLMRLYAKFVKDHQSFTTAQLTEQAAVMNVQRLLSILDICKVSVEYFGDNRKQFLQGTAALTGTTAHPELRRRLLAMTREWVLGPTITFPTAKERASLMTKMAGWQTHNDAIYRDYLNLVYEVYSNPSMARSDLTMRLEGSFILGCRVDDLTIRSRFLDLFNDNIPKAIGPRLAYIIGGQSWDSLHDFNWTYVVLDMIIGAANGDAPISPKESALATLSTVQLHAKDWLEPLRPLLFHNLSVMHQTFVALFPEIWGGLPRREQADITASIVHVLTKDCKYEIPQPNVYQTLLAAIQRCSPALALPPHVLKYLAKSFQAWYEGLEILQQAVDQGREDESPMQDANQDALASLYAELSEDDYFYGLWRRRSLLEETNAALSYEQNGFYHLAQPLYEVAQVRARQGVYAMSESEYYVWEDHWMLCSEKLLQWDILGDIASSEGNPDLSLECAWRSLQAWNMDNVTVTQWLNHVQDPPTPRRQLFKAFYNLYSMACTAKEQQQAAIAQGMPTHPAPKLDVDANSDFTRTVDNANQIALKKWVGLPEMMTMAHVPLLAQFQQVIELKEAALLMTGLIATNKENLPEKAHEAKNIFHHWRERLPLPHDDIGLWNDLIAWRQHVFHAVNKFYLPLLPDPPHQNNSATTHAHRGHHESAWIINRFAHVARKHGLLQVCQNSLSDIYKLPNIEISEAFLKLREQARCHLEKPSELYMGLEVINNTNLMYFTAPQKAEFFAIKGLFLHKLERHDDANAAFGQAVQLDFSMPKAWRLWGVYADDMNALTPTDYTLAANAVSCYLQAASLYKSSKSRPLLNRILWLLSMDDHLHTVGKMWEQFKGEHVFWYWITMIPQLLLSLGNREAPYAYQILLNIAKIFPQSISYQLKGMRDEHQISRREHMQRLQITAQNDASQANPANPSAPAATVQSSPGAVNGAQQQVGSGDVEMAPPGTETQRHAWDLLESLIGIVKTGHPLLALTMESLADNIKERLKIEPDEDIHRMCQTLLAEAIANRAAPQNRNANTVSAQLHLHAKRLHGLIPAGQIKDDLEAQLFARVPTMLEFIRTIIDLRDHYEVILDRKPRVSMEVLSLSLVEFHIARYEKMQIPGQYLEHKDSATNFADIKRISTAVEKCRSPLPAYRRISLIAQDGSEHAFTVQYFGVIRTIRRDERVMQLIRIFNETLLQKKEARKRNLQFHILSSITLNPHMRLVKMDSSYVGLIQIHDEYCKSRGFGREEPMLAWQEKVRAYIDAKSLDPKAGEEEIPAREWQQVRLDTKNEIEAKYIPSNVLSTYMTRTMSDSYSLWTMRKQFTLQIATTGFLTYCMFLTTRPQKLLISRRTGFIGLGDCAISMSPMHPMLQPVDSTPFRLTANIQEFITPTGMEGLLTAAFLALSRGLLEPECEVQRQMWLFIRDDFITWYKAQGRNPIMNEQLEFRLRIADSIEKMLKRMSQMTALTERKNAQAAADSPGTSMPTVTVVSPIQQLINSATNPAIQAKNNEATYPWF